MGGSFPITMHFVLESLCQWVFAHLVSCCIPIPQEFDYSSTDAEGVFEELFRDGDFNWGRKTAFVFWLKKTFGAIKGFLTLCKINQTRLR